MPPQSKSEPAARVSDRVADRLMAKIADGSLAPGQRLPGERQLAEQMGVSRVSIRAALQRLKTQGFIAAVQGGGTRVVSSRTVMDPGLSQLVRLNHDNLHDLAEMRAIIEEWAARRAAIQSTPEDVAEMAAVLAAMEQDLDRDGKAENDERFHLAIAKASGSTIYMHIVGVVRDILRQSVNYHRYELFDSPADDQQILAHHRAIYEAIRRHDPDEAAAAMRAHLSWVVARYDSARRAAASENGVA